MIKAPEKRSQDRTDAAEDRRTAQEDGGQGAQQITIAQAGPKIGNVKTGDHAGKGRDQTYQHEGLDAGSPGIDAHQFGAVDIVANQVDVCTKSMAV